MNEEDFATYLPYPYMQLLWNDSPHPQYDLDGKAELGVTLAQEGPSDKAVVYLSRVYIPLESANASNRHYCSGGPRRFNSAPTRNTNTAPAAPMP